ARPGGVRRSPSARARRAHLVTCLMSGRAGPHAQEPCGSHSAVVARTVLIVDDHADFRLLARELLTRAGYLVVGEAADGMAAVSAPESLRPGVVLLDVQLPDADGFAVAERLAQLGNPPVVLLTSSRDATSYRQRMAASSARGFIPKVELSAASLA